MSETYNVAIGAKRQVTLPARLLRQLSLREGDLVQLMMDGDEVKLVPMVSVPRHMVSPELLAEMNARRGAKADDMPLAEFAAEVRRMGEEAAKQEAGTEETREKSTGRPGAGAGADARVEDLTKGAEETVTKVPRRYMTAE